MKKMVLVLYLFLAGSAPLYPALAQDHFVFPIEPGNEKWYLDPVNPSNQIHWWFPGESVNDATVRYYERLFDGDVVFETCDLYSVNGEGNVFFHGLCDDYQPAQLLLDTPFWVGKTWESCSFGACYDVTVTGEDFISVPFNGPYHCYVMETRSIPGGDLLTTSYINDGVGYLKIEGPTYTWALFDGVIPVESYSWGVVKSLYR
jgi:hypothetical protein